MRFLLISLVLLSIVFASSNAFAYGEKQNSQGNQTAEQNKKDKKDKKSKKDKKDKKDKKHKHNRRCNHSGGGGGSSQVPELDGAAAPVGILLIGGIVAAGLERRRKISIK